MNETTRTIKGYNNFHLDIFCTIRQNCYIFFHRLHEDSLRFHFRVYFKIAHTNNVLRKRL